MNIVGLLSKVLPSSMKERLKSSAFFDCYIRYVNRNNYPISLDYLKAQEWIKNAKNMVDLGCGSSPHWQASVAVDKYIEPLHRKFGGNEKIDVSKMRSQGIKFIKADLENLPFKDNEFDLAYSHHVVEHLDNPALAMEEMMRIAEGGVIICPGMLAEHVFGRKYHKWIVTSRKNLLIFIEKNWEMPLFGEGPFVINGKTTKSKNCNPFDLLLNDGNWYHGRDKYKNLSHLIRKYWYGHDNCMETCFLWKKAFNYIVIYNDGRIISSFDQ